MRHSKARITSLIPLVALLGLSLGASAAALVAVSSSHSLEFQTGRRQLRARMSRNGLIGPQFELQRTSAGLRGRAYGLAVDLGLKGQRIAGQVGPDSVQLDVRPDPQGLDLRGTFAGQDSDLRIMPTTISGTIGWCRYSLVFAGDRYSGWRGCGASVPQATTLRLPVELASLTDVDRAAVLAVLLARK